MSLFVLFQSKERLWVDRWDPLWPGDFLAAKLPVYPQLLSACRTHKTGQLKHGTRDYVLVARALSLERSVDLCPDTYTLHHTNTPVRETTVSHRRSLKNYPSTVSLVRRRANHSTWAAHPTLTKTGSAKHRRVNIHDKILLLPGNIHTGEGVTGHFNLLWDNKDNFIFGS